MSLLIRNVRVLVGAKDYPEICDVFVVDDKIAAIGKFPDKKAAETIDGQGAYLAPGFIDVNTDSDHYLTLFEHRGQEDFLRQGVTTIFGGMCGSSLAPLFYGTLESVRKWGGTEDTINIDWHSMKEFLAGIDRRPLAVNFGTLTGHGTIRRALTGDALRTLTKNEMNIFGETLRKSLGEGSFGMSTNLGAIHAEKAPHSEIAALLKFVKDANGIYATHPRSVENNIFGSIEDAVVLAKETGTSTLINHFVPVQGAEQDYEKSLDMIGSLPEEMDFHFDIYPSDALLLPFYTFLPAWVRVGGFEAMRTHVKEDWLIPKIVKDMESVPADRFTVAQAPGNDFLVGKSLSDLALMYGVRDGREALLRLMKATKLRGVAWYRNLDAGLIRKAIMHPRALIASNAPSFDSASGTTPGSNAVRQMKSERTTSTFTKFLSLAESAGSMPFADAVRKITYLPARKFGLLARGGKPGRGEIKEGNYADLVCFKNAEIKCTVVGGKVAMKDGVFRGIYPGRALRHA